MIVDRYLGRTVLAASGMALLALLAIDLFFAFVRELQDVGQGHYGTGDALIYLALTVPGRAVRLFPMSVLLGTLLGLGHLAAGNELTALRTAGLSRLRIMMGVLATVALLALGALVVQEWVAPAADRLAQRLRAEARQEQVAHVHRGGYWIREGTRFIHLAQVTPDGRVLGVTIHELPDHVRIERTLRAREAVYHGESGWMLHDVTETIYREQRLVVSRRSEMAWPSLIDPELLDLTVRRPEQLSNRELARYIDYMKANRLEARRYELAYWRRLTAPVSSLVMVFLAMPFVFATQRIASQGVRVVIGILAGLAFYLVDQTLSHMGEVFALPPLLGALAPSVLFLIAGIVGMARTRQVA